MKSTTTRALREHLRRELDRAARGDEILVTKRGRAYVRIVPASAGDAPSRYPLRGSVLHVADDFDAPVDDLFSALDP